MIVLDRVSLHLEPTGLHNLSLRFEPGTWTFIIGPSGAGKTLILETLAGLHMPESGRILIGGRDVTVISPESRRVALVYQDYSLFPHMTVTENIAFGLMHQKIPQEEREREIADIIRKFHLEPFRDRFPDTLSGGEQQRVAIARALAIKPDILLLDEPFAALDPITRQEHMFMIQQIQREQGLTIVQVSHSREETFALADRVAVIIDGRVVQTGTSEEVFFHPSTPEVARFSGIENIFSGTVISNCDNVMNIDVAGQIICAEGPNNPGEEVTLCIRGTDIKIGPNGCVPDPSRMRLSGVINGITPMEHTIRVAIGGQIPLISIVPRDADSRDLVFHQTVTVLIDMAAIRILAPEKETTL
jgi:ABC-type Fe3+/spermidine/putrescine transport system ATPase subunit